MNAIQKKLKKLEACKEGVKEAGQFRTAKEAWHGWTHGGDLVWLLVALRVPLKRLRAALDAVVNQALEWAEAAAGKERARCAAKPADAAQAALYPAAAAWAAYYAAETAAVAGVMTYKDAQAVLADLVRREVPWEEVKGPWENATNNHENLKRQTNERNTKET